VWIRVLTLGGPNRKWLLKNESLYKYVIIQFVSVFITPHLYTFLFGLFNTPAVSLFKKLLYCVPDSGDKVCRFLLLLLHSYGSDFMTFFWLHFASRKLTVLPFTNFWGLVSWWNKTIATADAEKLSFCLSVHPSLSSEDQLQIQNSID